MILICYQILISPLIITRRHTSEEQTFSRSNSGLGDSSVNYTPNIPDKQLRLDLYHSVYNPGYNPRPDASHIWAKHSGALNRVVAKQTGNPRRWSNEEVIKFIQNLPNCKDIGHIFRKNVSKNEFLGTFHLNNKSRGLMFEKILVQITQYQNFLIVINETTKKLRKVRYI